MRALCALCPACDRARATWQNTPNSPFLSADLLRARQPLPVRNGAAVQLEFGGVGEPPRAVDVERIAQPLGADAAVRAISGGRFSVTCSWEARRDDAPSKTNPDHPGGPTSARSAPHSGHRATSSGNPSRQ